MILSVRRATEPGRTEKVLVYDGECPFCAGVARAAVRTGLVAPAGTLAFQDAEPALAERLRAAGIADELLVLERGTGELRSGAAKNRRFEAMKP